MLTVRKRVRRSLEELIICAQEDVIKAQKKYDLALETLTRLMNKREEQRRKQLLRAAAQSRHTFDEIMTFIQG